MFHCTYTTVLSMHFLRKTYISDADVTGGDDPSSVPAVALSITVAILWTLALSASLIITGVGSNIPSDNTLTDILTDGSRRGPSSFHTALDCGNCCKKNAIKLLVKIYFLVFLRFLRSTIKAVTTIMCSNIICNLLY